MSNLLGRCACLSTKSNRKVFPEEDENASLSAEKLGKKGNNMAEEIVISYFVDFFKGNPNGSLDEGILGFENAKPEETLEQFAENRTRTPTMYRESYEKFFNIAKQRINMT